MRNLSPDEQKSINVVIDETSRQRRAMESVDTNSSASRFFLVQAEHHSLAIIIHHATGRKVPDESREFLRTYVDPAAGDFDRLVNQFIRAIEKATGRELEF